MLIRSQYRDTAVGMSSRVRNSKKCAFSLAWKLDIELNWHCKCQRGRLEPSCRTLIWLSQCVSTTQRDAEHRWTA